MLSKLKAKRAAKRLEEQVIRREIMLTEIECIERFIKQLENIDDKREKA